MKLSNISIMQLLEFIKEIIRVICNYKFYRTYFCTYKKLFYFSLCSTRIFSQYTSLKHDSLIEQNTVNHRSNHTLQLHLIKIFRFIFPTILHFDILK